VENCNDRNRGRQVKVSVQSGPKQLRVEGDDDATSRTLRLLLSCGVHPPAPPRRTQRSKGAHSSDCLVGATSCILPFRLLCGCVRRKPLAAVRPIDPSCHQPHGESTARLEESGARAAAQQACNVAADGRRVCVYFCVLVGTFPLLCLCACAQPFPPVSGQVARAGDAETMRASPTEASAPQMRQRDTILPCRTAPVGAREAARTQQSGPPVGPIAPRHRAGKQISKRPGGGAYLARDEPRNAASQGHVSGGRDGADERSLHVLCSRRVLWPVLVGALLVSPPRALGQGWSVSDCNAKCLRSIKDN
jgi:hypothetical protein